MPEELPLKVRMQVLVTRFATGLLRLFGIREWVIRTRSALARRRRRLFERLGSDRYSSPALHGMDRKLEQIVGLQGGFFVEAGGHDGYTQSNTYRLESLGGWSGILVEPMPELAAEARLNRPRSRVFQCALVGAGENGTEIEMQFGDLFTTVAGTEVDPDWTSRGLLLGWRDPRTERVKARSLSSLLDEAGVQRIDLLSLDVEGYEAQVLSGLDMQRHAPAWLLIEMHDLESGRAAIAPALGGLYVEHSLLSPLDVLYRRRSREELTRDAVAGGDVGSDPTPPEEQPQ